MFRHNAQGSWRGECNSVLPPEQRGLPVYTRAEVAQHHNAQQGVWVILGERVYDVTHFISNHPGGVEKIMTAAGGSVEPFWRLYRQHVKPEGSAEGGLLPKDHVAALLEPLQIGWLAPTETVLAMRAGEGDDPYSSEPWRHPALISLSETPCSAESPMHLLGDAWMTPNALFYVRNHHPVPTIDAESYTLSVRGLGISSPQEYSLARLSALPCASIVATIQCGGNRRGHLNEVAKTSGNAWGAGAISNARWTGVWLRDLLADAGLDVAAATAAIHHIHFEGGDGTTASIPTAKALGESGDVLIAWEMNGVPLPRDHGAPLRVVVPGYVGVRHIKWLKSVVTADKEAEGVWQRGVAYKTFGPSVRSVSEQEIAAATPIMEMPVQSAILAPAEGTIVDPGALTVSGFAWSGGGRGVIRVDVSGDGGETWVTAELGEGSEQPADRAWAWTFWHAEVQLPATLACDQATLICKAVDAAHNVQALMPLWFVQRWIRCYPPSGPCTTHPLPQRALWSLRSSHRASAPPPTPPPPLCSPNCLRAHGTCVGSATTRGTASKSLWPPKAASRRARLGWQQLSQH